MVPRCFLLICVFVLFVVVANVSAIVVLPREELEHHELELADGSVEARNPALAVAIRVLSQAFKWAAKHCIKQAAHNCKQHWKNPKELVKCGGHYLKANKGRCVVG